MPPAPPAPPVCNVNAALVPLLHPVALLRLDKRNARKHDDRNLDAIARSLATFGQQKPFVTVEGETPDEPRTIIAGNGGLQAAKRLGWTHVAVVTFPDADRARAYALADNRTGELSAWDDEQLLAELEALRDDALRGAAGFEPRDLEALIAQARPSMGSAAAALLRLPQGERSTLATMTFTLTPVQRALVLDALALALRDEREEGQASTENRNARGLARLCSSYLEREKEKP